MDVNLPSISELSQMQFLDPNAYGMAQKNIDLANQFQQQNLRSGEADIQAKTLANVYNQQTNPFKTEAQRLQNEGLGYDNRMNRVKADITEGTASEAKEAARQKFLQNASDDELKALHAKAEMIGIQGAALVDAGDPNGQKMLDKSKRMKDAFFKTMDEREKQAADLKKTEALVGGRLSVAETNAGASGYRADRGLEGTKYSADARVQAAMKKAGGNPKTLEAAITNEMGILQGLTDPAERQAQLDYINTLQQALVGIKQASQAQGIDTAGVAQLPQKGVDPIKMPPVQANRPTTPADINNAPPTKPQAESKLFNDIKNLYNGMTPAQLQAELVGTQQALAAAKSPDERRALQEAVGVLQQKIGGSSKQAAPQAPAGRVVIYKDGKPVGSVPQAQADLAVKQGYSLK